MNFQNLQLWKIKKNIKCYNLEIFEIINLPFGKSMGDISWIFEIFEM